VRSSLFQEDSECIITLNPVILLALNPLILGRNSFAVCFLTLGTPFLQNKLLFLMNWKKEIFKNVVLDLFSWLLRCIVSDLRRSLVLQKHQYSFWEFLSCGVSVFKQPGLIFLEHREYLGALTPPSVARVRLSLPQESY